MYKVYVVQLSDGSLYVGNTADAKRLGMWPKGLKPRGLNGLKVVRMRSALCSLLPTYTTSKQVREAAKEHQKFLQSYFDRFKVVVRGPNAVLPK